ncbi:hypothetical protein J19TS2_19760 [Cohnella xylanilytica]|nr:hypothetical protein J19TS2_19760 [Cohnella xylanilytica]
MLGEAGRVAKRAASRLSAKAVTSLSICPESDNKAKLLVRSPPTNSRIRIPAVIASAMISPDRLPAASK